MVSSRIIETTVFCKEAGLLMKKLLLYNLCVTMLLVGTSKAGSSQLDLSPGGGTTIPCNQVIFVEVTEAIQASAPSGIGFEEYATREAGTAVSEPATMLLVACGLIGVASLGRKRLIR